MKFFIDSALIDEVIEANDLGVICGVTTNPSLIAKSGRNVVEVIKQIAEIVDGPISAEVNANHVNHEDMVAEGIELAQMHKNIVVKIPMTLEGLKAVKILNSKGIKTNVTLIFSTTQALLAARSGATYVSPFVGRIDDINMDGQSLVREVANVFAVHNIDCEIISASLRNTRHVVESAVSGAHIATVPLSVIKQMANHPLTDQGIERFIADTNN